MTDFTITKEMWQNLTATIKRNEGHKHSGVGDSFQLNPAESFSFQQYYALISRVTLTPAQVLALHTTPVVLVPAMGARSYVLVDSVEARLAFNSVAYTGTNALEVRYTDGSGTKATADLPSAWLDSSSTAYQHASGVATALTPTANAAIVAAVPTANPAAGNSPVNFITNYRVITF